MDADGSNPNEHFSGGTEADWGPGGSPAPELDVVLSAEEQADSDIVDVTLTVTAPADSPATEIAGTGTDGLTLMPATLFAEDDRGSVLPLELDPRPIPATLGPGQSVTRKHWFLSIAEGSALLRAEFTAKDSEGEDLRDAHYAELDIEAADDAVQDRLEQVGALENFISDSHDVKISASQERGQDRAKKLKKLPKKTRKAWLGTRVGRRSAASTRRWAP